MHPYSRGIHTKNQAVLFILWPVWFPRADPGFEVRGGANGLKILKNRGGGGGGGGGGVVVGGGGGGGGGGIAV